MRLRRLVWLIPNSPPSRAEPAEALRIRRLQGNKVLTRIRGAIFCQVRRIKILTHERPLQTNGTQKQKGAPPNFIIRGRGNLRRISSLLGVQGVKDVIIKNKSKEDQACIRKYFKGAWSRGVERKDIRGIKASRLSSIPAQATNHEKEEIDISVPKIRKNVHIKRAG